MYINRYLGILFITHRFPPRYNAGTENYTYGIASALREQGHNVHIVCGDDVNVADHRRYQIDVVDEPFEGLPVRRLRFNYQLAPDPYGYLYVENPRIEKIVTSFAQSIRPDVIHVTSCVHLSASVLRIGRVLNIPTVLTLTDFWFVCPQPNLLRKGIDLCEGQQDGWVCLECMFGETKTLRWLKKFPTDWSRHLARLLRLPRVGKFFGGSLNFIDAVNRRNQVLPNDLAQVDLVLSPSKFLRQWFIEHRLVNPNQIIHLPHGHKTDWAAVGKHKTPSDTLRFGYTGHIKEHKGVHLLIQAFKRLDAHAQVALHIYGQLDLSLIHI
ncbi:MAG: glycosyltransferase, partial [Anaerolineae bacterium]|nr:glycosyltransferase [Anaerolineae bacterium]